MRQLLEHGAITIDSLRNLQVWRLITVQLIHVSQYHMLYNAASMFGLAYLLERRIGTGYLLTIWLLAGGLGTLSTNFFGTAPWNAGTAASQAALGMAGFGVILIIKVNHAWPLLKFTLALTIVPAFCLDCASDGYPKPGHVFSLIAGAPHCAVLREAKRCDTGLYGKGSLMRRACATM